MVNADLSNVNFNLGIISSIWLKCPSFEISFFFVVSLAKQIKKKFHFSVCAKKLIIIAHSWIHFINTTSKLLPFLVMKCSLKSVKRFFEKVVQTSLKSVSKKRLHIRYCIQQQTDFRTVPSNEKNWNCKLMITYIDVTKNVAQKYVCNS